MIESYDTIYDKGIGETSIEKAFKGKVPKLVIRDDRTAKYMAFETRHAFLTWQEHKPKYARCYNEVIFGQHQQKIRFDVDAPASEEGILPDISKFMEELLLVICEVAFEFGRDIDLSHITVLDGTRKDKVSYHIIVPDLVVPNNEKAKEFAYIVAENLKSFDEVKYLDLEVYKSIQNFRLLGSTKPGKGAPLVISQRFGTAIMDPSHLFIMGDKHRADMTFSKKQREAKEVKIPEGIIQEVMEQIDNEGHVLRKVVGNKILFNRTKPTECKICGEVHHKDNTKYITIEDANAESKINIIEHCRHCKEKELQVCHLEVDKQKKIEILQNPSKIDIYINNPQREIFNFHRDGDANIYEDSRMHEYELKPTLLVMAQMGMGKTKQLKEFIGAHFKHNEIESPRIVFITFRQTFSRSIKKIFEDFKLYSDIQGTIELGFHNRIIVQVESLHRIDLGYIPEPTDLVIMDESEAIISQFNSGLHKNFTSSFATFKWFMRYSKHVICMDANMSDRTYNVIKILRPDHPISFHQNTYDHARDHKYFFTFNKDNWINHLFTMLAAGKKIVVPSNSLNDAKGIQELINSNYPSKKTKLYSRETQQSEKNEHFSNIHEYWGDLDVLIYTPTCSAGLSFELEHYDTIFGFFTNLSCDVETSRQMLGRVRNISSNERYIYLTGGGVSAPVTRLQIKEYMYDRRKMSVIPTEGLSFEFGPRGQIRYQETEYFHVWIENMLIENLSKANFARRFISQVVLSGATCSKLVATMPKSITGDLKGAKEVVKQRQHEAIAMAPNIDMQKAMDIIEKMQCQQDITDEESYSYKKYKLLRSYRLDLGRDIDDEFVAKYEDIGIMQKYKKLQQLHDHESPSSALLKIKKENFNSTNNAMSEKTCESEYWDLQITDHAYWKHEAALGVIAACGISFGNHGYIHMSVVEQSLAANCDVLGRRAKMTMMECKIPPKLVSQLVLGSENYIATALKVVNAIIGEMYGHKISNVPETTFYNYQSTKDIDDMIISKHTHVWSEERASEIIFAEEMMFILEAHKKDELPEFNPGFDLDIDDIN